MNYGFGWNSCGCSTVYTDAYGNPITGCGSGADGTPVTGSCVPNWGLLAMGAVVAIGAMALASGKHKRSGTATAKVA